MKLTLATRRSPLALWQAETTKSMLEATYDDVEVELLKLESKGDVDQTSELQRFGRIGIFTVEVDRAVVDGRADIAVHSLKDLTTQLYDGTVLTGTLPRGLVEDAWICPDGTTLDDLPTGSRVATGSLRRKAMLLARRPDLEVVGIRGNVDTRLRKLGEGEAEAMILARAGIERLGLSQHVTAVLDTQLFLPAVGQGIVGLTCREGDDAVAERVRGITDLDSFHAASAERGFLAAMRGGCNVPAGAHATLDGDQLLLRARVLSTDGRERVEGERSGPRTEGQRIGQELADELAERGATRLIDAARQ